MKKRAQYSSAIYNPQVAGKTLQDLYMAIQADAGLSGSKKMQLVSQIQGMTGFAGAGTPLSALMLRGLGGTIGWLIGKYFGMGSVGQVIAATAGFGIGNMINKQLNKPKNPFPGYQVV